MAENFTARSAQQTKTKNKGTKEKLTKGAAKSNMFSSGERKRQVNDNFQPAEQVFHSLVSTVNFVLSPDN